MGSFIFATVAEETSGVWAKEGLKLVNDIGQRITGVTVELRATNFLRQHLCLAV
jgi:hypothetical protein